MSDKPAAKPADGKDAKGGKSKMMMIVAAVVLLAGAGGGYFWYSKKQAAAAEAAAAAEEEEEVAADSHATKAEHGETKKKKKKKKKASDEKPRVMAFEPFVVNLADPGAARFLRTSIQLVVVGGEAEGGGEGEGKKGPSVEELRARSAIIELLSAETSDELLTAEGKAALKEHITERMDEVLEEAEIEVEDVLFSDFVIQF